MATERQRKALERMTPVQRAKVESIRASNQTPERRAELTAVHEHYLDRPTRDELIRRGEIDPERGMPMGALVALHKTLAELKRLRECRGLSAAEVGRRAGIASAAMSRLESGQNTNPTYATLARYAKAIGAELSLQVRVPNGSPEEESNGSRLTAESVASLHAALTMVLRQLESLQAHVGAGALAEGRE